MGYFKNISLILHLLNEVKQTKTSQDWIYFMYSCIYWYVKYKLYTLYTWSIIHIYDVLSIAKCVHIKICSRLFNILKRLLVEIVQYHSLEY